MVAIVPQAFDVAGNRHMVTPVLLVGSDGEPIAVNGSANALVTIDAVHRHIHLGHLFEASRVLTGVADAGLFEALIKTGAKVAHVRAQIAATGVSRLALYQAPTTSGDGTAMVLANRNRLASGAAVTAFYTGPTVSVAGVQLADELLPGGSTGGNRTVGSTLPTFEEWVLAPNTTYLVRGTNISGSAISAGFTFAFYETDPLV